MGGMARQDEGTCSVSAAPVQSPPGSDLPEPIQATQDSFPIRVVAGTFGNRQGLRLDATCGPFTHQFTFKA